MNKYFEIDLALQEIKEHYKIQSDSFTSLMRAARGTLTTSGYIISILSIFQLISIKPDFTILTFQNFLLLILVVLFFYILYKCVKMLSPKEIYLPKLISDDKMNEIFIVENEKEAKTKILKLYYAAIKENKKTIDNLKIEIDKINNAFAYFLTDIFILLIFSKF